MKAGDARRIAARWVEQSAAALPGFQGAFFHGSINDLADDDELPATSDLDVGIVVTRDEPEPKLGKAIQYGLLLDLLGCRSMSAPAAARHLDTMTDALERAGSCLRSGYPFAGDLAPDARAIATRGSRDLIERGLHREVAFRNEVPEQDDTLNYAVLRNGGAELHLGREREMENAAGQGACNFITRELDAVHRRAREAGAVFYIELSEIPTGARTFGIEDPSGNLITFVEAT